MKRSLAQQILIELTDGYYTNDLADKYACGDEHAEKAKEVSSKDNLDDNDYLVALFNLVDGYSVSDLYYGQLDSGFTYQQVEDTLKNALSVSS